MNILTQKHIDIFWGKVDKEKSQTLYNGTRCWEWTGYCTSYGYGQIGIGGNVYYTHRVSYKIEFGDVPDNLHVLHHCDNPPCVNPKHLFLGTDQDNIIDKVSKGRQSRLYGESNGKHKLTDEQVYEIRRRYKWFGVGESSTSQIAKEFGVSLGHIQAIVSGKRR